MTDDLVKRLRDYDKPGITMTEAADRIDALEKALREIANMGQSQVPDHWDFRCKAREIARAALGEKKDA